jgi:Tol biopolymer transport system component
MHIKKKNGIWGTPAVASFSGEVMDGSPIISGDGDKLFIYRKVAERDIEIIYFTKSNNKWSNPKSIVKGFSPTVAKNGNVYFNSDDWIYKVEFRNGKYIEPRQLNKEINLNGYLNWTPFVAPDESYLIFSRCDRNGDYGNLYICFWSDTENNWTEPVEIGELINTPAQERFPSVSPDGKYLFFTRSRGNHDDIYWVSAKVIQDLKEKHKKK